MDVYSVAAVQLLFGAWWFYADVDECRVTCSVLACSCRGAYYAFLFVLPLWTHTHSHTVDTAAAPPAPARPRPGPRARAPAREARAHVRRRPRRPLLPLKASEGRAGFPFPGARRRAARRARVSHTVLAGSAALRLLGGAPF